MSTRGRLLVKVFSTSNNPHLERTSSVTLSPLRKADVSDLRVIYICGSGPKLLRTFGRPETKIGAQSTARRTTHRKPVAQLAGRRPMSSHGSRRSPAVRLACRASRSDVFKLRSFGARG